MVNVVKKQSIALKKCAFFMNDAVKPIHMFQKNVIFSHENIDLITVGP